MSNRKNLANGILALGVSDTDTTWVLQNGYGAGMPDVPFYLTATPFGQLSTMGNSEIVNVTARTTDTLTVQRGAKGTTAKAFAAGAVVSNGIYVEDFNSIAGDLDVDGDIYSHGVKVAKISDIPAVINYSTSEQDTGQKWIDGKTIYQKTVYIGSLPNAAAKNVAHGIASLDRIVRMYGTANSGTVELPLPFTSPTASGSVQINRNAANLDITTGTDRSGYSGYITLTYTKT